MKRFLPQTGKSSGFLLLSVFLFFNVFMGLSQTVTTDKDDYHPGDIVQITGEDWLPYESVNLHIISDCGCTNVTYTVTSDASGAIFNNDLNITEDHIGASFVLTATGDSGSVVQTTFTDSGSFSYTTTSGFNNSVSLVPGSSNSSSLSVNVESPKNNGNFDVSLSYNNTGSPAIGIGSNANEINFSSIINSYVTTNKDGDTHSFPISVSVGSAVPPGTYNFQVSGIESAGNIQDGPRWDFEVVVGSTGSRIDALSVGTQSQQIECGIGGATNYTITATRGGSGTVNGTYSVSGLPSGVNSNFSVENFTSSGSDSFPNTVLTLTAPTGISVGNYSFNVFLTDGSDQATNTGSLSVSDTFPPSWSTALNSLDRTVECSDVSALANAQSLFPEATDICDPDVSNIVKTAGAFVAASCSSEGTYTNTWTVTDDSGNVSTVFTQTITVEDTTEPTFTVPGDLTLECDQDDTDLTLTGDVTDEADNCSTGLDATFVDDVQSGTCEGTFVITRTWSLSDNCGNPAANQVQTITVSDNTAPSFTAPADIEIFTDASCAYDASVSATGDVTDEADNCSTGLDATFVDDVQPGTCEGTFVITRTWSLSDNCGNPAANQVQTITVSDNTAPSFTAPADIEIFTDASCAYDASVSATGDVTDEADNCSTGLDATFVDDVQPGTCEGTFVITRTWSLSDNCGNPAANQVQTITVSDNTAPSFTAPADIEIFTDASCAYDASVSATGDVTDEADNCSTGLDATFVDDVQPGTCEGTFVITRTWSLSDNCGNPAANQVQTITVSDNTAPSFTAPADIEIFTDASCAYDASVSATGDVTDEADNCSTGLDATFVDDVQPGTCEGTFVITRTWSLSDNCGNPAANQVQTITVSDNTAPSFTAPADIEIFTDASCAYDASVSATGDVTDEADNCSTGLDATFVDDVQPGTCEGTFVITRTWSLSDNCGNPAANQVQTITVSDNTAPSFTAPADIEIFTDASCAYDASVSATGDVTDEADNCSTGLDATFVDDVQPGTCEGTFVITRTWSLSDNCGNPAANQVQTITVSDNTAPSFTAPADIEIFTDASCAYDASVSATGDVTDEADNCSTGLDATFVDDVQPGTCEGTFVITRTWSLSDNCGNPAANQVQTITVSDNTAPSFTAPADIEIFTDASCAYDASVSATGDVTDEADNCSTGLDATFVDDVQPGTCEGTFVITRTWSLSDNCGNPAANQVQTITVSDNTAPSFTAPADIEIFTDASCAYDASVSATGDVTDEADNCSTGLDATFVDDVQPGTCEGTFVITRTWSLSDNCGNPAANQVQTITVSDNTAPSFTAPADIEIFTDASCAYDVSVSATGDVTDEADNCSTGLDATFVDDVQPGTCEGTFVITRTWSLSDNCGNPAANQVQTITVSDNTAPSFTAPADIEIFTDASCAYDASVSATGDVTDEADNCSTGLDATFVDDVQPGTCEGTFVITRTWSLSDNCGNPAANQVQTITVSDNTAPTFTAPADIEIFTDASCAYDASVSATGDVTDEADNCSTGLDATFVDDVQPGTCEGTFVITRTWSLSDNCGNPAANQVQTITVSDNTAPSFTAPADIEIFTDASCAYDASVSATGDVTDEADNCSTGLDATFVDDVQPGTCEGTFVITRTWSLSDNCGNPAANQVQTITVSDNTAPSFTAPADIEIFTDASCAYDASVSATGDVTDEADNCSTGLDATFVDDVQPGTCEGTFVITRTWSLSDNCGNPAANQVQTITVSDNTAPSFTAPADIEIFTDASCAYDASVSATGDVTDEADNCSTGLDATFVDDVQPGTCEGTFVITRTWSLSDNCGNPAANQVQTITVSDNTAPSFTAPADIEIFTDASCAYDVSVSATGDVTDEADNCSTGLDATFVDDVQPGTCEGTFVITRTWSLSDNCGNPAANQVQTITVSDNTAPSFTAPADIEIFTDASCAYDASVSATGDVTDEADNCSTGLDATFVDDVQPGTCEGTFVITRTWSLSDNCGNPAANQVQTITVSDNTAPSFTAPADIEIFTDASCAYDASVSATGDVTDEADNCSTGLDATFVDDVQPGTCEGTFVITRTWSLSDNCGNPAANQVQTITVSDNTAPSFTAPADIEIFTDASCAYDVSVSATGDVTDEADNCSTGLDATFVDDVQPGTCEGTFVITRTWSLSDNCGNPAANQVQTITVSDNTAPSFTAPADIEIFTDASCAYDASVSATGDVTDEADNCSTGLDATFVDDVQPGTCEGTFVITRTWSLSDNCGNPAANQVQTITVSDNTAPTFTAPADIEIFTDASCAYDASVSATGDVTDEADNCSTGLDATFVDDVQPGTCEGTFVITRTWSLSDNCGNPAANQVQTITVSDNTAPSFTAPADIEIFTDASCAYDASVSATGDVTDEADNCSTGLDATFVDDVQPGTCEGTFVITRTWSLSDNCGNPAANQVQTITVSDNTAPSFTAPADIEIFTDASCAYDASVSATGDVTDEADNCSTGLDATFVDDVQPGTCEGTFVITRTWSLSDNCGNPAANQVQTITVSDNTAPSFTAPADIEIFTDASCAYDASVSATGDVTDEADNCSTGLDATFVDDVQPGTCEGTFVITRTWSLSDNCGNPAANQVQTITVSDNTAPSFTAPADIEIFTDASCAYDVSVSATGDVTDEADNCSTGLDATFVDDVQPGTCEGTFVITRTWSLSDNCGNPAANQVQTITVSDNTAPSFTAPADIEIFTDASCAYDASVSATGDVTDEADNCSTGLDATFVDDVQPGTCEGTFVITRTWSLSDNCGNPAANQVQTITVSDNTAPSFTAPADIEIFTDASCAYDASVSATGDVTDEADNCSTGLDATFVDDVQPGTCEGTFVITRTWSLSDNCGNPAANQVQTITVSDNTAPSFTAPADIEIFTDASCAYDASVSATGDVTDEADNCSTGLDATFVDDVQPGTCEGTFVITRTWSLSDNCGNPAANQVQTITVSDNTAPSFTAPADIEIFTDASCAYDASVSATGDVTDEADNCSTGLDATFVDDVQPGTCEGTFVITRTWSLSDNCGNAAADQVQTITVSDDIDPDLGPIVPLDPIAVNTTFQITAPSIGDNCSDVNVVWYFDPDGEILDPLDAPFTFHGYYESGFVKGTFSSSDFETTENPTGTGVYSVMLVVTDACGNESIEMYDYVVIYDPSGGFVTGGGWFYSVPENLYDTSGNPTQYEGKANFGFNAKYKSGKNNTTEVDGNTNFQFKEGDFHFKSSSHDDMSLVISGYKKATYRGRGTVNGAGDHKFMVTVIDGDATGGDGIDRFRIKIWGNGNSSVILYDNERTLAENVDASTAIGGGSIVIHKPKGGGKNSKSMETSTKITNQNEVVEIEVILNSLEVAPNPMVYYCDIKFSLKEKLKADLSIFDLNGRQLKVLYSSVVNANEMVQVKFDRGNLPSGIYICKLMTGDGRSYEKQIIID
ncbi:T9SS type A sorting domain-containing protein [Christiangramia echinicola]|uniref:Por secretion system C-terminal sorting domain-containing protein n=1 Tax=Christiangramia echinicola TaxID=279359 RepID=A0A1H1LGG6_9FLAO|nr:T9SS type A sorting domain-containing protein [Christiangramia echinicola]SDR73606.1 Por secretion system C-terminal sorting domain-containing protein [Christiangramia echinicola]